jgi:hypothetical protein
MTAEVNGCWTWLSKLAAMTQLHLRNAADYHMFFHEANELDGLLSSRLNHFENSIASIDAELLDMQNVRKLSTLLTVKLDLTAQKEIKHPYFGCHAQHYSKLFHVNSFKGHTFSISVDWKSCGKSVASESKHCSNISANSKCWRSSTDCSCDISL